MCIINYYYLFDEDKIYNMLFMGHKKFLNENEIFNSDELIYYFRNLIEEIEEEPDEEIEFANLLIKNLKEIYLTLLN